MRLLLQGVPSTYFPNAAFLNFVLYGHTDVPFSYNDFKKSYGFKVSTLDTGNLIIGKDGKLGGILVNSTYAVIPIPKGNLTKVANTTFSKYFPRGYVILENYNDYVTIMSNTTGNATLNGTTLCSKTCSTTFSSSQLSRVLLTENNAISFSLFSLKQNIYLVFFGYLSQFNTTMGYGKVTFDYFYSMANGYSFANFT